MGDTFKRVATGVATGGLSELSGAESVAHGLPGGGGKKSAPAPPDFAALAAEQTKQNRPNQSTPFGATAWGVGPDGRPTQTTGFSAELSPLASSLEGQASSAWATPLDNGAQARDRAETAIYGRETSRLDPMWQKREADTRASLANQGLDPSSEAGGNELNILNRGRNDAYTSALQEAIMGGGQEASRQQAMDLVGRAAPLQGLSSLRSLLQMPGYGQAGDVLGAGKMGYDANLQNFEANGGPLGGWGQLLQALAPLVKAGGRAATAGG